MLRRRLWFDLHVRGYVPASARGWFLVASGALFALGVVMLAIASSVAGVLLLTSSAVCAVADWQGYTSVLAAAWRRSYRRRWVRFLIACAYLIAAPVPFFLVGELRMSRRAYLATRRARIEGLERALRLPE